MTTKTDCDSTRGDYPWEQCISDQLEKYGDKATAEKVCGAIKEKYGHSASASKRAAERAIRRAYTLGAVDKQLRTVDAIVSTANPIPTVVDRNGKVQEFPLAIESWDIRRYEKNPVVLWAHEADELPIAKATQILQEPDGLHMRVQFPTRGVSKKADEVFDHVCEGLVRAFSVGFGPGEDSEETRDGQKILVRRNAQLSEVSMVAVPADEDALVELPAETDEERRARIARAASTLSKSKVRTDALEEVERCDFSRLEKFERTPTGGLKIPARIARTGILVYRNPDGTERRELRLAEECFKADSLKSLEHGAVTDLEHHRGLIDPENWKDATLGHVANVRADGDYVVGDIMLNDASAIADVESGKLVECSAGYRCRLDWTSGTWKGERYDAIQRDIKYNHVAVLPPGRGRAGADVGLRLDSTDETPHTEKTTMEKVIIRLDGKDFEFGSKEHVSHLDGKIDALGKEHAADLAKVKGEKDAIEARLDAAEKAKKKMEDDAGKNADTYRSNARAWFRKMRKAALRFLAEEDQDDEEKMDAKIEELAALTDRDLHIKVIRSDADYEDFDGKDKSDEYVAAVFDIVTKKKVERSDSVDNTVRKLEGFRRAANGEEDPEGSAREAMKQRNIEAGRKPFGVVASK